MGDLIGGIAEGKMQRDAGKRASRGIQQATASGASELIPTQQTGQAATDQMAALLGLSGDPGAAQNALRTFMDSAGFQDQLRRGTQAISGSAALGGVLQSGATATALQDRGQQMAQEQLMNYLAMLDPLSGRGAQASGNIGNMRMTGGQNAAQARLGGDMASAQSYGNAIGSVGNWFSGGIGGIGAGGKGSVPTSADWSTGVPRY